MDWAEVVTRYRDLASSVDDEQKLMELWGEFRDRVADRSSPDPYHLRSLINQIETYRDSRPHSEIVILDHGCGGGTSLIYLAALGYTNIYGVDVGTSKCERWNGLFRRLNNDDEKRFHIYGGEALPLPDQSVDVVVSQEVLEHVSPEVFDAYYAEEDRVLKHGGMALHSVPHRLVPYDSHTQTWLLHWFLPRSSWIKTLKFLGKSVATAEVALFLRWPWVHKKMVSKHFDSVNDVTLDRLTAFNSFDYYDGPVRLRVLLTRLVRLPVLGRLFGAVLSNLVMIDTVSRKA